MLKKDRKDGIVLVFDKYGINKKDIDLQILLNTSREEEAEIKKNKLDGPTVKNGEAKFNDNFKIFLK